MSLLVTFTFRTFSKISALKKQFPHLFIFNKLKTDIKSFCNHLQKVKPDFVIGVAAAKAKSVIEPTAINNIHGHKVIAVAPNKLSLYIPNKNPFSISPQPSNSFCNYSMFRIQYFVNQHHLSSKLIFIHLNPKDIPNLSRIIQ